MPLNMVMPRPKKPPASAVALTVSATASYLGCSNVHVYRLIKAQLLPAVDISTPGSPRSKTRILLEDLQKFLAAAPTPSLQGVRVSTTSHDPQPTNNVAIPSQNRSATSHTAQSTTFETQPGRVTAPRAS